eukprot:scaffold17498_cov76-Phaeocystis_antarctica.AAC.1
MAPQSALPTGRAVAIYAHHVLRVAQRGVAEDVESEEVDHVVVAPPLAVVRGLQPGSSTIQTGPGGRPAGEVNERGAQLPPVRAQRKANGVEPGARRARLVEEDERMAPTVAEVLQRSRHPLRVHQVGGARAQQRHDVAKRGHVPLRWHGDAAETRPAHSALCRTTSICLVDCAKAWRHSTVSPVAVATCSAVLRAQLARK